MCSALDTLQHVCVLLHSGMLQLSVGGPFHMPAWLNCPPPPSSLTITARGAAHLTEVTSFNLDNPTLPWDQAVPGTYTCSGNKIIALCQLLSASSSSFVLAASSVATRWPFLLLSLPFIGLLSPRSPSVISHCFPEISYRAASNLLLFASYFFSFLIFFLSKPRLWEMHQ